jgi:hypothetical protein
MQSEQINELAKALSVAQAKIENATLNKINPHFKSKYADLSSVIDSIREPLSANGLAVSQSIELREGGMILRTVLMHSSGQWIASEYPLPQTARPQELGSALTYARRYSLSSMVCNSADEDDDANAAEDGKHKIEAKGRAPKPANVAISAPAASEYKTPSVIAAPDDPKGWIAYGQVLIAAVKAIGQSEEWIVKNEDTLDRMKKEAPKVWERVMANITPQKEAAE